MISAIGSDVATWHPPPPSYETGGHGQRGIPRRLAQVNETSRRKRTTFLVVRGARRVASVLYMSIPWDVHQPELGQCSANFFRATPDSRANLGCLGGRRGAVVAAGAAMATGGAMGRGAAAYRAAGN